MFKRKPFLGISEKVARRVRRIPTGELHMWADNALSDLGRCLSSYQRTGDEIYIREALNGAEALHAVVHALHQRSVV